VELIMYDDPDPVRHRIRKEDDRNDSGWAMGALLVLLLIGAVFMFTRSDRPTNTASNSAAERPAATAPANPPSTTGSGSSTRSDRN
jgi:hypothetical protein